jgi:hypothetical protein
MTKIIEIDNCYECPYRIQKTNTCEILDIKIHKHGYILENCPLKNK